MFPRFQPGDRLGDLAIERELGQGAFAVVYLARDVRLDRPVALKVLAVAKLSDSAEDRARLLQEARLVARLQSPHIVSLYRVHDLGNAGLALEMEYMDGGSLADLLKTRARLPPEEAVAHLRGLLSALEVAHAQGVVHRDIKPENLLFSSNGELKLADFGLGRQLGDASLSGEHAQSMQGTPLYMSPEVVGGQRATPASDLWSAGVVLHRMLTGRLPFEPSNLPALFYAIHHEEPAPLGSEHPAPLARIVARCLEKEPARRPESARAVLRELSGPGPRPRAAAPAAPLAPGEPPLGRESELATLTQALERAGGGGGGGVLLLGEPGAGKTTLLLETARRAQERAFQWIDVALTPLGGLQRPLVAAARHLLAGEGEDDGWAGQITSTRFGPAATLLRGLLAEDAVDLQSRQQLVWAVEALLRGFAAERPVVVAIEGAHFADGEDLRALGEIVRRLADAKVCVLVAYRTHDPASSEGLTTSAPALAELSSTPGMASLPVGPLPEEALRTLVLREAQAERVAPEVRERVRHQSEGNALFAIELVRHLLAEKAIEVHGGRLERGPFWDQTALPRRLSELVSIRLQRLTEDQRSLLDAAAVDGVTFDGTGLAKVLGLNLLHTLRSLQRITREHGLLAPQRQGYRFAHAMFRDVIYRELAPDLKRHLHRAMAEHLETEGIGRSDPERAGTHWEQAGNAERAVPLLRQAALDAARRQDYTRALDLAQRGGVRLAGTIALVDRQEGDLLLALAGCLSDLERGSEAVSVVAELQEAAARAGDRHLRMRATVWRADFALYLDGAKGLDAKGLEEAAQALPDGYERGRAHYLLGHAAQFRGDLAEAERRYRAADVIYQAEELGYAHAQVVHLLGDLARAKCDAASALELFEEAARLKDALGRRTDAAVSRIAGCLSAMQAGRLDAARATISAGIRELELTGAEGRAAHAGVYLAKVDAAEGEYQKALNLLEAVLPVLDRLHLIYGQLDAHLEMGHVLIALGRGVDAQRHLAQARSIASDGQDADGEALAAALDVKREALTGDVIQARALLPGLRSLFGGLVSPGCRAEALMHLAQCAFYDSESWPEWGALQDLLPGLEADPQGRAASALLHSASALRNGASGDDLVAAAAELRAAHPGLARAEVTLLAEWLETIGRARRGEEVAVSASRQRMREAAERMAHRPLARLVSSAC